MKPRYRLMIELSRSSNREGDVSDASTQADERRLQISLRGILSAFAWTAVWGVGWAWSEWLLDLNNSSAADYAGQVVFSVLLLAPPAAAIGALVGRQLLGIVCGMASAFSLALWILLHS
ncbi:hypothetical protein [Lacipirellula limnantheis]|nr:hypothetical protein [Lacipirellula limnantheis]